MPPPQHAQLVNLSNAPQKRRSIIADADEVQNIVRETFAEVDKVIKPGEAPSADLSGPLWWAPSPLICFHRVVADWHFVPLQKDGSGFIDKDELLAFVSKLMPLSDPANDIDCICAAIDKDEDGEIPLTEFQAFIQPAIAKYMGEGKQPHMEDILHEAFKMVLAESKLERDLILQAFMQAERDVPESSDVFHRGWVRLTRPP
jgi:hypothetical protein